jgi:hypothetical protein
MVGGDLLILLRDLIYATGFVKYNFD